jgi:hypothetical protein
MSRVTLNNKLSKPVFAALPPTFPFSRLPESGIMPVGLTLEEAIGTEMVLFLFDRTPFIHEIVNTRPFELRLSSGIIQTSHGPLLFFLFFVPDPVRTGEAIVMLDYHVNPLDPEMLSPWHDLARQSYWHVLLINGNAEQVGLFEIRNIFELGNTLKAVSQACMGKEPGNFDAAKAEFCEQYGILDLFQMTKQ